MKMFRQCSKYVLFTARNKNIRQLIIEDVLRRLHAQVTVGYSAAEVKSQTVCKPGSVRIAAG
jgi:hypothetical protein